MTTTTSLLSPGADGLVQEQVPRVVSHAHARTIAIYWLDQHDPDHPVTLLAHTGRIGEETAARVETDLRALEFATAGEVDPPVLAQAQLTALLDYVQHHGPRDPVPGWTDLPYEDEWSRAVVRLPVKEPARVEQQPDQDASINDLVSVYERLGGGRAIAEIVDTFYQSVLADPTLAPYFDGIDVQRVKAHQYAFITAAADGPAYYTGRSLHQSHSGLGVTPEHFDRFIDHLTASLEGRGINQQEIAYVVGRIARHRDEIVAAE